MTDPEECDIGEYWFTGENKNGYVNYNALFDDNPKTNTNLLLGCTINCEIETGFKCPAAADVAANDNWALATCTDRCGDGIYDGVYTDVGRNSDYPTDITNAWPDYDTGTFTTYITSGDYSSRLLPEQCDTEEVMNGDYDHGCTELCQISTETLDNGVDPEWVCTHYYLDLIFLEEPLFRSHCEW